MAATDQTYRPQKWLDVVFGVSCVLMLVSIVWMFYQDQYRDWKVEQRVFRDVEEAMALRDTVNLAPDVAQLKKLEAMEKQLAKAREAVAKAKEDARAKADEWTAKKLKSEQDAANKKADLDSIVSFYDIAVDNRNAALASGVPVARLDEEVKNLEKKAAKFRQDYNELKDKVDVNTAGLDKAEKDQHAAEKKLADIEKDLKELKVGKGHYTLADFDRFYRLAESKRWGAGDWFRSLPVIDAFASPTRIHQFTLDKLPIDYNFKFATRYDRCMTCHQGIDRATYTKQALTALTKAPSQELQAKVGKARKALKIRQDMRGDSSGFDPDTIDLVPLPKSKLTPARINEYAVHPRLDVFVGDTSPHPSEKFGCTICHGGQGSATDFFNASHTPNDAAQKGRWEKDTDWHSNHYWDFPMQPKRFVESSCVKCHHQMTDLIQNGSQDQAPKLLKGYNLVRENGCFGCHEISGTKKGESIGPDMRLEPYPALVDFTPAERTKMLSDPLNMPGTLRKVGPSLRRLSEKTTTKWVSEWIKSPRGFRPETRMPHFYGLYNSTPANLPDDQKKFPDAEIHAISYYLMHESEKYLEGSDRFRLANLDLQKSLLEKAKTKEISKEEQKRLEEVSRLLEILKMRKTKDLDEKPTLLVDKLKNVKLPESPKDAEGRTKQFANGRRLFSERGCLACHQHQGTTKALGKAGTEGYLPEIKSDAMFGPDLSRVAAKLGSKATIVDMRKLPQFVEAVKGTGQDASARAWLVQWLTDPNFHSPRTRMPIMHLEAAEANDVAAWLLSQKVTGWEEPVLEEPSLKVLQDLAKVYLSRVKDFTSTEVDEYLKGGIPAKRLDTMQKPYDADERELQAPLDEKKLKRYIGKKSINQLGCFGCHDIPGFEYAKPIGTPLNDWGKKDPERLAFEDAIAFVRSSFNIVPQRDNPKNPARPARDWVIKEGKTPYEKFFAEALEHHTREGFLHQKLVEPRSYDYQRLKLWDDRLRMPQFKFARNDLPANASEADKALADKEEAEAREAVMTFILGLVAEPIPAAYVNHSPPEKLKEVKGRQVLDAFNCAGCHMVRPGVFNIKVSSELTSFLEKASDQGDHFSKTFHNNSAWADPQLPSQDKLTAFASSMKILEGDSGKTLMVRLSRALSYYDGQDQLKQLPAAGSVELPAESVVSHSNVFGGAYAELLTRFLAQKDKDRYKPEGDISDLARGASPPPLLREGEKTQPQWLFQFLRNPGEIRPQFRDGKGVMVLRMPRFNMSDEDATALVDYFAAADKITNPGMGLNAPFFSIVEKDKEYLDEKTADYVERLKKDKLYDQRVKELKPVWERIAQDQLADARVRLKDTKAELDKQTKIASEEKDPAKKENADKAVEAAKTRQATLEKEIKALEAQVTAKKYDQLEETWRKDEAYLSDGYRLMADSSLPML